MWDGSCTYMKHSMRISEKINNQQKYDTQKIIKYRKKYNEVSRSCDMLIQVYLYSFDDPDILC
jgi:hypothetical protein